MTTTPVLNSPSHNLQSTQQALNMLRHLREKRKKQNPATIYELVKEIHGLVKDSTHKKGGQNETLSSEDYLASNRESIEGMLIFIKNKIVDGAEFNRKNSSEQKPCDCQKKTTKLLEETFQQSLAKKQQEIQNLNLSIKSSEQQSKTLQIKLLNNIKRLNTQIQQRETQLNEIKKILSEREAELDQVVKLNEKQHKKIRKMEQDLYDLQLELEQKNEELQAERECADFLQKRVGKFLQIESQVGQDDRQQDRLTQSRRSEVIELEERPEFTEVMNEEKLQIGTQTDIASPAPSPPTSEQFNRQTQQAQNQDKMSQNSSILTESKQSKYIESIERLTMELGQAYQRINELMKDGESGEQYKTVEMITCDNIRLQSQKRNKNMVNVGSETNAKTGKSKSRSGYFSKFWK